MPRLRARLRMRPISRRSACGLCTERSGHGRRARTDRALPYVLSMAKAGRILAALKRGGWIETRRAGSHRVLVKGDQQRIWAYHDGVDLGSPAMARIARDYGYTVDELRKL
jgi:predicted RNA binding protein YcfA (HicA-like mRNA interferase family)